MPPAVLFKWQPDANSAGSAQRAPGRGGAHGDPPALVALELRDPVLRHAPAVDMAHQGIPLVAIQRQLGHANLGITSVYLQGIDSSEIIDTVHGRPSPTISASARLQISR
jgi:integrase